MTDETVATATTEQATQPAGSEQATPETSIQENAVQETETKPNDTQEQATEEEKPKRLNSNQRKQRAIIRLANQNAELAAQVEALKKGTSAQSDEPKEADYNGDYSAYLADRAAWKAASKISQQLTERDQKTANERLQEHRQEAADEFLERAEEVKTRISDFDAAFESFAKNGGQFAPHIVEELHDSDRGPELAYQLAKNPKLASELNAMSPRDAAREIGRLEAKLSLPNQKQATKAPPPLKTPTGGASPPVNLHTLAKSDDVTAYWEMRKQQMKASA